MCDNELDKEVTNSKRRHSYSQKVIKELTMVSQGLCAKCHRPLIEYNPNGKGRVIMQSCEIAHIYGLNEGSARYEYSKDEKFLNSYENLIVLCSNCHKKIDNDEIKTTVDDLKQLKKVQEISFFDSVNKIENKTKHGGFTKFENLGKIKEYLENDEDELKLYKNQIVKLNNLTLSVREALLDLSNNVDKRMFSYFRSAYDEMTKVLDPLITYGFIDTSLWEGIPDYDRDEPLEITIIWQNILDFFNKNNISLESIIIDRNYSVLDN